MKKTIKLFTLLEPASRLILLQHCVIKKFSKNSVIVSKAYRKRNLYIIAKGVVTTYSDQTSKDKMHYLKAGEIFDVTGFLSGQGSKNYYCAESETTLLIIKEETLKTLGQQDSAFIADLHHAVTQLSLHLQKNNNNKTCATSHNIKRKKSEKSFTKNNLPTNVIPIDAKNVSRQPRLQSK
jgi:signal-transduction protein with cAMP-binding, CBS, and nucleotidyltransferase domain